MASEAKHTGERRFKITVHDRQAVLRGEKALWDVIDTATGKCVAGPFAFSTFAVREAMQLELGAVANGVQP